MTLSDFSPLLQTVATVAAAITAIFAYHFTKDQAASQQLLAQRQMLISIWHFIADLNDINPKSIVTPDVVKAANTLDLIAVSCRAGIVDTDLIKLTFQDRFIELYEKIAACDEVPGLKKSGKAILSENKSTVAFYDQLIADKKATIAKETTVPAIGGK